MHCLIFQTRLLCPQRLSLLQKFREIKMLNCKLRLELYCLVPCVDQYEVVVQLLVVKEVVFQSPFSHVTQLTSVSSLSRSLRTFFHVGQDAHPNWSLVKVQHKEEQPKLHHESLQKRLLFWKWLNSLHKYCLILLNIFLLKICFRCPHPTPHFTFIS